MGWGLLYNEDVETDEVHWVLFARLFAVPQSCPTFSYFKHCSGIDFFILKMAKFHLCLDSLASFQLI